MEKELEKVYVVAGVILKRDNKYLLVQEKQPSAYGLWNLPAGKVDLGESIEEAAIREAKEECGLDVKLLERIGIYHEDIKSPVKHIFNGKIIGGEIFCPKDELLDVKWFTYDEIYQMVEKLRKPWILEAIRKVEQE